MPDAGRASGIRRSNGHDGGGARQQAALERLILNGDGEIVPTRHAQDRSSGRPRQARPRRSGPRWHGEAAGPGRRTDLIADHFHLFALTHQPQHGEHEILARRRRTPRRCAARSRPAAPCNTRVHRRVCWRRRRSRDWWHRSASRLDWICRRTRSRSTDAAACAPARAAARASIPTAVSLTAVASAG